MTAVRDLALLVGLMTSTVFGCSLIRDLSVDQCSTNADCTRFGSNYECSDEKVCVGKEEPNGGKSGGGSGGNGATSGSGGTPVVAECKKNADCIDAHDGEPYICRDEACVPLTIPDHCPIAIAGTEENPTEYLTKPGKPIIFGAYVPIDVANPIGHPYTLNYRFALEEFMESTLGGVGSPARPYVMILCQSTKPDLEASAAHLIDTVQVPAILASLPSDNVKTLLDRVIFGERKVFLLDPLEADVALTNADDNGLLWHMLGPVTDLIPAYVPLIKLAEAYSKTYIVKNQAALLKLAVVHTDATYSVDMANELQRVAEINGFKLTAKENKDYYDRYEVKVSSGELDTTAVTRALKLNGTDQADIIISLGGAEFIDPIFPAIQEGRLKDPQPFYILSPRNAYDKQLTSGSYFDQVDAWKTNLLLRHAGVNFASVEDTTLYDTYLTNIQAKFQGQEGLESRENFYDAAYFMLYSLAAASRVADDFDGNDVLTGMKALIDGEPVNVGPEAIANTVASLLSGAKFSLVGTMGPPDFNAVSGARKSQGSVWCLERPDGVVQFDAARLDPEMPGQLKATTPFCYDNFIEPPAAQ